MQHSAQQSSTTSACYSRAKKFLAQGEPSDSTTSTVRLCNAVTDFFDMTILANNEETGRDDSKFLTRKISTSYDYCLVFGQQD